MKNITEEIKSMSDCVRNYLELTTHEKITLWRKMNYPNSYNPEISLFENDKLFFLWSGQNNIAKTFFKEMCNIDSTLH